MVLDNFIKGDLTPSLFITPPTPAYPSWSFSTIFSPSRACRTLRATLLEPLLKWLGMTPFL